MAKQVENRKRRNREQTKQQVLEAGEELFASKGYHAVTVYDIVERAGCNRRMLYYYFGNKEGLYVEVLRFVFALAEADEMETVRNVDSTETAIRELLRRYFEFLQENPNFVKLLLWENLNEGRFLKAHPNLLSKMPILGRLRQILRRGAKRGELKAVPDSRHLLVLMIGVCFIYFSNRYTLSETLGVDLNRSTQLKKGLRLAQEVFIQGLIRK